MTGGFMKFLKKKDKTPRGTGFAHTFSPIQGEGMPPMPAASTLDGSTTLQQQQQPVGFSAPPMAVTATCSNTGHTLHRYGDQNPPPNNNTNQGPNDPPRIRSRTPPRGTATAPASQYNNGFFPPPPTTTIATGQSSNMYSQNLSSNNANHSRPMASRPPITRLRSRTPPRSTLTYAPQNSLYPNPHQELPGTNSTAAGYDSNPRLSSPLANRPATQQQQHYQSPRAGTYGSTAHTTYQSPGTSSPRKFPIATTQVAPISPRATANGTHQQQMHSPNHPGAKSTMPLPSPSQPFSSHRSPQQQPHSNLQQPQYSYQQQQTQPNVLSPATPVSWKAAPPTTGYTPTPKQAPPATITSPAIKQPPPPAPPSSPRGGGESTPKQTNAKQVVQLRHSQQHQSIASNTIASSNIDDSLSVLNDDDTYGTGSMIEMGSAADGQVMFDDEYVKGKKLGAGSFAKVYVCQHKFTGGKYAVKEVNRTKMQWSGRDALVDEILTLQKLMNAPHIIQLQDVFHSETMETCFLVLELLPGGELFARIIQKGVFLEEEAQNSCRCVLEALEHMHERRIVHRDLKPENLLLKDEFDTGQVKLSDFGFAKTIENQNGCRTLCGTPGYIAPEILERWPAYDTACDTFSFGVIMFLMLGGYLPFDSHNAKDNTPSHVFERTRNGQYHFYPQRWKNISSHAKDLVARCLAPNPAKRFSAKDALQHNWMTATLDGLDSTPICSKQIASVLEAEKKQQTARVGYQEGQDDKAYRVQELNDDFTVYLDQRRGDSIASHMTGTKTVATTATTFREDSPSGRPFSHFYDIGEKLGKGGFATVYRCRHKQTMKTYAVKEIDLSVLKPVEKRTLNDEITALKYLRGAPYIIRLYDVFETPKKTFLVLEEMKGGDLLHRICEKEVYTELEARDLCRMMFHAVDYCHKKRIAHRDIKLDNLLLVETGNDASVKLADFGFAKKVTQENGLKTMCGTPNYMAPEIFDNRSKGYDHRCDMWAVGVVVYCLLGGYLPFEGHLKDIARAAIRGEYRFHEPFWNNVTRDAKHMITSLLQTNPDVRYTARNAITCPWMGADDEDLSTVDLSTTQGKFRTMKGREKMKNTAKAIAGANKLQSVVGISRALNPEGAMQSVMEEGDGDEDEELRFEDLYTMGEVVGQHIYADVHIAHAKASANVPDKVVAVKKVIRRTLHPSDVAALHDEIMVLKQLVDCPQILTFLQVFEDFDATFVVTKHVPGEVLIERLIQSKKYTEFDGKEIVRNLLAGLDYMHRKRIANRNLKLENLLLPAGTKSQILISNFEFAKVVAFPNSLRTQCGTQEYVAPEVLENRPAYDVSCDMWTLGVIVYVMLGGYYPFRGSNHDEILKNTRYGIFEFHPKYWNGVSDGAQHFIQKLLVVNPDDRISAKQALHTPWIQADNSILSADLKDGMQSKLRQEMKRKFKGVVQTIIATRKLQTLTLMK